MRFKEFVSVKDAVGSTSSHLAIISSYRKDRPERLNQIRYKELAEDIDKISGFQYTPMKNKYLIMAGATTHDSFVEYIVYWLNKYEQDHALIRFSNDDIAWKVLATGNKYMIGSWSEDIQPKIQQKEDIV